MNEVINGCWKGQANVGDSGKKFQDIIRLISNVNTIKTQEKPMEDPCAYILESLEKARENRRKWEKQAGRVEMRNIDEFKDLVSVSRTPEQDAAYDKFLEFDKEVRRLEAKLGDCYKDHGLAL